MVKDTNKDLAIEKLMESTRKYPEQIKTLTDIQNIKISGQSDLMNAGDLLIQIRKKARELDTERKENVNPFNASVKKINNLFNSFIEPLEKSDEELANKVLEYFNAETLKLQTEFNNALAITLKEHDKELKKCKKEGRIPPPPPTLSMPEQDKSFRTPNGKLAIILKDDFVVEDICKVPIEFLVVDTKKVREYLTANPNLPVPPGIKKTKKEYITIT